MSEKMKIVKKEDAPYTVKYDDIVEFTYENKKGYYCDGCWFDTYEHAWNFRAAGILGG